jgi:hypothetical protein
MGRRLRLVRVAVGIEYEREDSGVGIKERDATPSTVTNGVGREDGGATFS